jgi:hypothetical protein
MMFSRRTLVAAAGWIVAGFLAVVVAGGVAAAGADSMFGLVSATSGEAGSQEPASGGSVDASAVVTGGGQDGDARDDRNRPRARAWLWRHLEHGEFVVRRPEGHENRLIQRGDIVTVSAESMTVRSPDGFTATWSLGEDTRVRKQGDPAKVGDLRAGDRVVATGPGKGRSGEAALVRVRGD